MEVIGENNLARPNFSICLNHCPFSKRNGKGDFWICYSQLLEPTRDKQNGKYELSIRTRPSGGSCLCVLFKVTMLGNQFHRSRMMRLLDMKLQGYVQRGMLLKILSNAIESGFLPDAEIAFEQPDISSCPLYMEHCVLSKK